jgi:hypothetical protein
VLLFTYVHTDVLTNPEMFTGATRLHASLSKVGEQLTFGMDPDDMGDYLTQRGLEPQWDLGAQQNTDRSRVRNACQPFAPASHASSNPAAVSQSFSASTQATGGAVLGSIVEPGTTDGLDGANRLFQDRDGDR